MCAASCHRLRPLFSGHSSHPDGVKSWAWSTDPRGWCAHRRAPSKVGAPFTERCAYRLTQRRPILGRVESAELCRVGTGREVFPHPWGRRPQSRA